MEKGRRVVNGKQCLVCGINLNKLGRVDVITEYLSLEQRVVGVPNYDPRATFNPTWGYEEDNYCDDITSFVNIINANDKGEDTYFYALDSFIDKHVQTFHRLIDTDLLRSVSILIELMGAVAKRTGENLDRNDKNGIFRVLVNREISRHKSVFYIVRYRMEGNTPQPYLAKF